MSDPTLRADDVARFQGGSGAEDEDVLAIEEPLEIRLGRAPICVTMRTPGHDRELAAGFLFTEGIIHRHDDLQSVVVPGRDLPNVVKIRVRPGLQWDRTRMKRYFYGTSSCGVCGKTALQAIQVSTKPVSSNVSVSLELLYSLPERLRDQQESFEETGGLHAAAIFDERGEIVHVYEDVGRHNAVDKAIGAALLAKGIPLDRHILMVSGRTSFEIMQKALVARIPIVASVSAPSSLAVALARQFGMTLVGFLRGQTCNVYAGKERIGL